MGFNLLDLLDLKAQQWTRALYGLLATVGPGVLLILEFRPDIFGSLDVVKLMVLALAITLPVVVANILVAIPLALLHAPEETAGEGEDAGGVNFFPLTCTVAAMVLYLPLIPAHFLKAGFGEYCLWVLALNGGVCAMAWLWFLAVRKRGS